MKKFCIVIIIGCFIGTHLFGQINNKQHAKQETSVTDQKDYWQKKAETSLIKFVSDKEPAEGGNGYVPPAVSYNFDNFKVDKTNFKNLPGRFDLREHNRVTPAKSQGSTPACWAFAACGAIESYWLTIGEGAYNLSEQNVATCHGFSFNPATSGGNANVVTSYLMRFLGPVLQSQDPFTLGSGDTSCSSGIAPVAFINQAIYFPPKNLVTQTGYHANPNYDQNIIKQAIIDYGALFTSNQSTGGTWGAGYTYCYSGTAGVNHGIALVGWDDNMATPCGNGAWIVKNSGGPDYMDGGYFYMAYNDTRGLSGEVVAWPSFIPYNSNIHVYQHDKHGMLAAWEDTERHALVHFTASQNHHLTQIGTGIFRANTNVTIDVFSSFDGSALNNDNIIASISQKNCMYPGFYTFDLPTPLNLTSGQDFYVRVSYSVASIPAECFTSQSQSFAQVPNRYWISDNAASGWQSINGGPFNIVVKAYADIVEPTSIATHNNLNISVFPNPANDFITITNAENERIEILNVLGEVVHSTKTTSSYHNIDISNLSNGTYFVKINSEIFKISILN